MRLFRIPWTDRLSTLFRMNRSSLARFAWLSIAAAILTIGLKAIAYQLTGSVGLLSDALESFVNLAGALIALAMLTIAARPADEDHLYGHGKAEYFSSGAEGMLILVAAVSIGMAAVQRLMAPKPLEQIGFGIGVSVVASFVNLAVALVLRRAGKQYNSITLEANAQHLMTDVWTSAGVLVGVGAVALTGWERLDPIVALVVAGNIVWSGFQIVRNSVLGLMDIALPVEEQITLQIAKSIRTAPTNRVTVPCASNSPIRSAPFYLTTCAGSRYMDSPARSSTVGTYRSGHTACLADCCSVYAFRVAQ
ncbi:MAG TPA: cation diffusion facilitator family transporter [Anaerolineales bacterium]|nr:cation diffusion facilitator family transporter [Anaerolineales bacterium]